MNELTIELRQDSDTPLYEQIYTFIKNDIRSGRLATRDKLPSTRALAKCLEVSRNTVELAYDQLISEGYIESVPYHGHYVCQIDGVYQRTRKSAPRKYTGAESGRRYLYDFTPNGTDAASFPYTIWRKLTKEALADETAELYRLGPPQGELQLRESICQYLYQARGVRARASNMVIGAGNDYLLMVIATLLREYESETPRVAMETPTYTRAYRMFRALGCDIRLVGMDVCGTRLDSLNDSGAEIAYIMPSRQYPLGTVMPISRRVELLKWAAAAPGRYLIEDDYDSEFRYRGKPIPALQGADTSDKVIYLGTFSKSISPSIRVSYMVLPDSLLDTYRSGIGRAASTVPKIDQRVLTAFLSQGYYERHLNKTRALYKSRHDHLISAVKKTFGDRVVISGDGAGTHILIHLGRRIREEEAILLAAKEGVKVYGLSEYRVEPAVEETEAVILMGYVNISAERMSDAVDRLKKAWGDKLEL